jgi:hypothetical protein
MTGRGSTPEGLPAADRSIDLLRRSGWITSECGGRAAGGAAYWLAAASRGEDRIQFKGETRCRAWHSVVEAAAASGMMTAGPGGRGREWVSRGDPASGRVMIIELVGGPHDGRRLTILDGDTEVHVEDQPGREPRIHAGAACQPLAGRSGTTVYLYAYRETSEGLPIFKAQA